MYKKVKDLVEGDNIAIVINNEDTIALIVQRLTLKPDGIYEIHGCKVKECKQLSFYGRADDEVYVDNEGKSVFVNNLLKPLLLALDMGIINAEYKSDSPDDEVVIISYRGGYKQEINVHCDNAFGITKDVLLHIGE